MTAAIIVYVRPSRSAEHAGFTIQRSIALWRNTKLPTVRQPNIYWLLTG
jgi:hypothetical protein